MPGHNYRLPKIETIEIPREGLTQGQTAGTGIVFVVYTVNCRLACRGTESLLSQNRLFNTGRPTATQSLNELITELVLYLVLSFHDVFHF